MSPGACVLAAAALFAASPRALRAGDELRLVSDIVQPAVIEPGRIAVRRVAIFVADGVTLSFPDQLPTGKGTEAARAVQVHRQTREGGVLWVLSYPFTAWRPGDHETGPVVLEGLGPAHPERLELGAASVHVASPLPEARLVRPAPRADVPPVVVPPWTFLPVVPVFLSVLSGAALWRRSRQPSAAHVPGLAGPPAPRPGRSLDEILRAEHTSGAAAARAIAGALRRHPRLVEAGVTPCHTRPQIERLVANSLLKGPGSRSGTALVDQVNVVLGTGDAAAYGAREPELAWVLDAGRAVREALDD